MKICSACKKPFQIKQFINGKIRSFKHRTKCLECAPFNKHGMPKENIQYNIPLTDVQQQILNGHMLGDGSLCLRKNAINAYFRIKRMTADLEYLNWTAKYFENYLTETGIHHSITDETEERPIYYSSEFKTRSIPIFTEYYNKWYPDGKKIVPKDLVLTPLTIAVWLADDGYVRIKRKKSIEIRFHTDGFSYHDVTFLHNQLQTLYDQRIYIQKTGRQNQYIISITNQKTAMLLINNIYDIFPRSVDRKYAILDTYKNVLQ